VQLGLEREGVRVEAAFLLPTENGDLFAVFLDVDDPEAALTAFRSSPLPVDLEHAEVMERISGGRQRTNADLVYAFRARG
jgi:Family of unknown function (DUF6176)